MKQYYVTYKTAVAAISPIGIPVLHKVSRAIECPSEEAMMECARDLYSYDGIGCLYLNRCRRIKKGTEVISYEQYLDGKF